MPISADISADELMTYIGVARYGALGHVPPRLPAVYFLCFTLYIKISLFFVLLKKKTKREYRILL